MDYAKELANAHTRNKLCRQKLRCANTHLQLATIHIKSTILDNHIHFFVNQPIFHIHFRLVRITAKSKLFKLLQQAFIQH